MTALAEHPVPPAADAAPAVRWGISLSHFGDESGQTVASAVLRRYRDSPEAQTPDAMPAFIEACCRQTAGLDVGAVVALNDAKAKAEATLDACAKRAQEAAAARNDSALLAAPDFGERLQQLDSEIELIASHKAAAEKALAHTIGRLAQLRGLVAGRLRVEVNKCSASDADVAAAEERALTARAAALLSPIIEELHVLSLARRQRPSVDCAIEALLIEKGFAPAPRPKTPANGERAVDDFTDA